MDNNNRSRVPRIHIPLIPPSPPATPFPPMIFSIATLATTSLLFMCIYYFSSIVSVAILLVLCIASVLIFRFVPDLEAPTLRERPPFYAQIPQNNQRLVRISNKFFWVAEEKRGNYLRKHGSIKKLLGSVVCFGSKGMTSSRSSECAICLEEFKKGEECFVFSICGHTFHCDCIKRWLEEKPNCPICRHCVPSPATMITNSRSIELLVNLV